MSSFFSVAPKTTTATTTTTTTTATTTKTVKATRQRKLELSKHNIQL